MCCRRICIQDLLEKVKSLKNLEQKEQKLKIFNLLFVQKGSYIHHMHQAQTRLRSHVIETQQK
ncbi:hypothetical protein HanXRQr2_Chr15g0695331 [Helianthus annuus]|uniref:Uncharacterized protein n=1 Tax=Helianthus annuus TaxID=4232 RepID=A0A251S9V5_HELAN|nr:hypothetical protein HanXRQr2_Chr15g0695331 [Helianthus annuus]KAJ0831460.1 hypothetical protein HanPSC8_Chr15g0667301 [Helianthus annuus]